MSSHHQRLGFTLTELLIVVSIIGVLALVAVPTFKHFVRKARQSEARTNLAAAYQFIDSVITETGTIYDSAVCPVTTTSGAMTYCMLTTPGETPCNKDNPFHFSQDGCDSANYVLYYVGNPAIQAWLVGAYSSAINPDCPFGDLWSKNSCGRICHARWVTDYSTCAMESAPCENADPYACN